MEQAIDKIHYRTIKFFGLRMEPHYSDFIWKGTQHGKEIKQHELWWMVRFLKCYSNGQKRQGTHLWIYTKWGAMLFTWGHPKMRKDGTWSK